jgi:hypothetical protein
MTADKASRPAPIATFVAATDLNQARREEEEHLHETVAVCWSFYPNRTFIRYIGQVLPALGERSVEQRDIDALISARHEEIYEGGELAALKGSGLRVCVAVYRVGDGGDVIRARG